MMIYENLIFLSQTKYKNLLWYKNTHTYGTECKNDLWVDHLFRLSEVECDFCTLMRFTRTGSNMIRMLVFFDVSIQYFCLFNYNVKLRAKWRPFSTHSICSPRLPRQVSHVYSFVKSASYHSSFVLDFPSNIRHIWYYSHIDTCGLFRELYWISPSKCWVAYIV